jgi:arabinose-5-phosphate isomerase
MIIQQAIEVLKIEANGILSLTQRIGPSFEKAVEAIYEMKGRLIVSGIGKSGIVGRKIVATLNSTGTRSFFLHPVEAMHGDLGQVSGEDIFLAISNSGETELNLLLPSIRRIGCLIIAFTGNLGATLAKLSDLIIDTGVTQEACPLGLAPTASTTAQLAMGDALAVVLMNKRHFKSDDFRLNHPGGFLGQRLSLTVASLMLTGDRVPFVLETLPMTDVIATMDRMGLGATLVCKSDRTLTGIITDGDIRRAVAKRQPIYTLCAMDIMTVSPKALKETDPAYAALNLMEHHLITVLPIVDNASKIQGILHLHDILGKGAFSFNGLAKG